MGQKALVGFLVEAKVNVDTPCYWCYKLKSEHIPSETGLRCPPMFEQFEVDDKETEHVEEKRALQHR